MHYSAYQVAPEYQEAPTLDEITDNTIIIAGNKRLLCHTIMCADVQDVTFM